MLNSSIEKTREINAWQLVGHTHAKGKAWDLVFNNGNGQGNIINKENIKSNAF